MLWEILDWILSQKEDLSGNTGEILVKHVVNSIETNVNFLVVIIVPWLSMMLTLGKGHVYRDMLFFC